jgi:AcrR family transcriptional regulator
LTDKSIKKVVKIMSPRNEEQNEQIKDERREQIMSAALKVFARKGFAAAKISDIVASTNMSHGLVYHYFKSKEEIFFELLKRAMATSVQSVTSLETMQMSPLEKVRSIAGYILGGIENYEDSSYYFLIVLHASVMEVPQEMEELMSSSAVSVQAMARIVQEGQKAGEIREGDPFGMAITFFAAIQGLAVYRLAISGFKMPDPEILVNLFKKQ